MNRQAEGQVESLSESVSHMLEECRMVLPGIQALFGFQLIVVFNSIFWEKLSLTEQILHFAAIVLVVCSIALVMTPAAYHRQRQPRTVSKRFLLLSTRFLFFSMCLLMTGILLECYLIGRLILGHWFLSALATTFLLCVFTVLWILLPRMNVLEGVIGNSKR
jgi:hypothetical protein